MSGGKNLINAKFQTTKLNLQEFIVRHQKYKTRVDYRGDELEELIEVARSIIQQEPVMIETGVPLNIVGDIHGQFSDLQRIFSALGYPGPQRYLFLGDYVDRGPQSLECICLLLAYKIAYPNRIYLLRGNHECEIINRAYGFWDELSQRLPLGLAMKVYKDFNELFSFMPLSAIVRNRILCMHGGLSPRLNSIADLKRIRVPFYDPPQNSLEQDLLWADPKYDQKGFEFNKMREVSVQFGEDVVNKICKKLNLDLVVRAHQVMQNGYGFFANRKLVTVFSAPRYLPDMNNRGAVMRINAQMVISFVILNPTEKEYAGAENFRNSFKDDATSYAYVD
uniref:Serine/threonine-protein phosphatase n=1 Tax=Panagrellus redivivus TaxID=6233 RepID=A0A7E4W0J2_PANRE